MKNAFALALVLTFASISFSASSASADPKKGAAGDKVKVYDFSGDTIEGDLIKPEGTDVNVTDFGKHSSLINIRKNFIPEIVKSAEDL